MNELLEKTCHEFIEYRDFLRDTAIFHSYGHLYPACAYVYMTRHQEPNEEMLELCRQILREHAGFLSSFRGNGERIFISLLSVQKDPGMAMRLAEQAYSALRNYFSASDYLPLLAFYMMETISPETYEDFAAGTRHLYDLLDAAHPLMTGKEDVLFCGLMHASGRYHEDLAQEAEEILQLLKDNVRFHKEAMQTLSHALTMCEGSPEEKTEKVLVLIRELNEEGYRYSRDFEMVPLGLLANMGIDTVSIMTDFIEVEQFLRNSRGYGFWGGFSTGTRLMHAVLVLSAYYMTFNPEMTSAFIISVLIDIERQQAVTAAAASA